MKEENLTNAEKVLMKGFKLYKKAKTKRGRKKALDQLEKMILEQSKKDPKIRKEWIQQLSFEIPEFLRKVKDGKIVHYGDARDLKLKPN